MLNQFHQECKEEQVKILEEQESSLKLEEIFIHHLTALWILSKSY